MENSKHTKSERKKKNHSIPMVKWEMNFQGLLISLIQCVSFYIALGESEEKFMSDNSFTVYCTSKSCNANGIAVGSKWL